MPSLHLARVAARFEGYRGMLDKKQRDTFDYLIYELAGRREETLISHPNHTEAAIMNILVEMELKLEKLEADKNHRDT
jgi:ribosomal protein L21E